MPAETTKWWHNILLGLAIICAGGGVFWYFWDFERSGEESREIWFVFAALYNAGGKWLASGAFVIIGVAVCAYGLIKAIRGGLSGTPTTNRAAGKTTTSRQGWIPTSADEDRGPRPVDEYIENAIKDLASVLGIKEPVAADHFVERVKAGQIEECIDDIGRQLGLPVKANLVIVSDDYCPDSPTTFDTNSLSRTDSRSRGTEGITAQILIPGHLPLYGSPRLEGFPITVKVSENCYAYPETFVTVMAHELSHVLLRSLAHPRCDDEIYTDLAAMLLGFTKVMDEGREVRRVAAQKVYTTTYGYLDNAAFGFALRTLKNMLHGFRTLRHDVLRLASELRSEAQEVEVSVALFNELLHFLDTHLDQEVNKQDSARIVSFHQTDYTQPFEAMARACAGLASEATAKAQHAGYFTRNEEASLKSYSERLQKSRDALAKGLVELQSDCEVLQRSVAV